MRRGFIVYRASESNTSCLVHDFTLKRLYRPICAINNTCAKLMYRKRQSFVQSSLVRTFSPKRMGRKFGLISEVARAIFRRGIHPEMLSPAILNRSMPRTPVSDMIWPPFSTAQKVSGEFPSLLEKYTRRQAHLEADHLFLSEPSARFPVIGPDPSEPSAYLPGFSALQMVNKVTSEQVLR